MGTLKARGIPTGILSNGDPEMLGVAIRSAGFDGLIDPVLSVHPIKRYKTDPQAYALGPQVLIADARGIELDEGRRFTEAEMESGANVCIIGPTVLAEIFPPGESPLGERMRLDAVSCQVVGVFATRGSVGGNGDEDNSVLMPLTNVQQIGRAHV